jgi:hypothetical protein
MLSNMGLAVLYIYFFALVAGFGLPRHAHSSLHASTKFDIASLQTGTIKMNDGTQAVRDSKKQGVLEAYACKCAMASGKPIPAAPSLPGSTCGRSPGILHRLIS